MPVSASSSDASCGGERLHRRHEFLADRDEEERVEERESEAARHGLAEDRDDRALQHEQEAEMAREIDAARIAEQPAERARAGDRSPGAQAAGVSWRSCGSRCQTSQAIRGRIRKQWLKVELFHQSATTSAASRQNRARIAADDGAERGQMRRARARTRGRADRRACSCRFPVRRRDRPSPPAARAAPPSDRLRPSARAPPRPWRRRGRARRAAPLTAVGRRRGVVGDEQVAARHGLDPFESGRARRRPALPSPSLRAPCSGCRGRASAARRPRRRRRARSACRRPRR